MYSFALGLMLAAPSHAAPAVPAAPPKAAAPAAVEGLFERVVGRVLVQRTGAKKPEAAAAGTKLAAGDEVRTLEGALAHITLGDGETLLVKEKSTFVLGGVRGRSFATFEIGEFLIGLKQKLRRGGSFRVRTPAAVAAVRGTLFWGVSDASNDAAFAALADKVAIVAQGKTVVLEPGRKTSIKFGQAPAPAQPAGIPPAYLDTFAVEGSLGGLKDLLGK